MTIEGGTMNQLSGGEAAVLMLKAHGVRHIFGLCGDTSLPFTTRSNGWITA